MSESTVRSIVEDILADYRQERIIDKLQIENMPDKAAITALLDKLFAVLYYGYYRDKNYQVYDLNTSLFITVEDALHTLSTQIETVLPYSGDYRGKDLKSEADMLAKNFFTRIPEIRKLLDMDLQAILDGDPAARNKDEIILSYPGFYAITVYRLAHELFRLNVPMIPRIMSELAHSRTGIDIHPGAAIGRYFFIDHGTGIVVGETTIIGEHVKLYQGVTLGAISTRGGQKLAGKKRHPTIEDNVTLYAGASVLGNTTIGRDSVIGGNVFITSDIPAGTTVSIKSQELHFKYKDEHQELTQQIPEQ